MKRFHLLGSTKELLIKQAKLHWLLLSVELIEEKKRFGQIIVAACIGLVCFFCFCIFLGLLAIGLSWGTSYFVSAIIAVCVLYGLISYLALRRLSSLLNREGGFFPGTRAEMAEDIEMIKKNIL